MATKSTEYNTGADADLYIESVGTFRAQVNGVYALSIIFLILCWLTVGLRMGVRVTMLKGMRADDWWLLVTQIIFTVYGILLIIICNNLLQYAPEYAAGEVPTSGVIPIMVVTGYCLYCVTTITFKFSLCFFFLNIFAGQNRYRIIILGSAVLPGLLGVLNIAWTTRWQCQLTQLFFPGLDSCPAFQTRTSWVAIAGVWAAVGAITDLAYGVLAFLAISKLNMPWKTRITAAMLCSLGCVGGVAAVIRLVFLIVSVPGMSVIGEALQVSIWSVIEPGLALIAASIAALRPLWMRMKDPHWRNTDYTSTTHPETSRNTRQQRTHVTKDPAETHLNPISVSQLGKRGDILVQVELDQVRSDREDRPSDDTASRQVDARYLV